MTKQELQEIFENVVSQLEGYSKERRASTQPYHLAEIEDFFVNYNYNQYDNPIREPLIEHVGSLPIIATALYPFIDDPEVNLGEALVMMAIHDIGELVTGDENTFTKDEASEKEEQEAALGVLHESYHDLYRRVEAQSDKTGQFAKSIDKIAPDFLDFATPAKHTIDRFEDFSDVNTPEDIISLVQKHKTPYMSWNPFMAALHEYLLERTLEKLKKG